jgi:hypothetical protein
MSCCHGGTEASPVPGPLGCLACGAAGCPACTVHLESAIYCRRCAAALLDTSALRAAGAFTLH